MRKVRGFRHIYKVMVMFVVNHILAGTWFYEIKRKMLISLGYSIGDGTKVVGPLFCTGQLTIGKACWVGKNLRVHGNGTVIIGDNCDIAPEVVFITGGHKVGASERRAGEGKSYKICIGNGTWIGARSTILKDVIIGSGCVIASCACVTSNIEDDLLIGGVPAKTIKKLDCE